MTILQHYYTRKKSQLLQCEFWQYLQKNLERTPIKKQMSESGYFRPFSYCLNCHKNGLKNTTLNIPPSLSLTILYTVTIWHQNQNCVRFQNKMCPPNLIRLGGSNNLTLKSRASETPQVQQWLNLVLIYSRYQNILDKTRWIAPCIHI